MGIFDSAIVSGDSESAGIFKLLTETKNFDLDKILTETPPDMVVDFSLMNVIQGRYKSKLLKDLLLQIYLHQMSKDRKRVGELVQISLGFRNPVEEED
jgi:hypothetical protein